MKLNTSTNGYSIIELVVSFGLLSILLVTILSTVQLSTKNTKNTLQISNYYSLLARVSSVLAGDCTSILPVNSGGNPTGGVFPRPLPVSNADSFYSNLYSVSRSVKRIMPDSSVQVIAQEGILFHDMIEITSLKYKDVSMTANPEKYLLTLALDSQKWPKQELGAKVLHSGEYKIEVTVDVTTRVASSCKCVTCFGSAQSASNLPNCQAGQFLARTASGDFECQPATPCAAGQGIIYDFVPDPNTGQPSATEGWICRGSGANGIAQSQKNLVRMCFNHNGCK